MIDVTVANFEEEVITASLSVPVLLDFWAPWCGPCKSLGPILEKLELAYAGRFKLVKIDADQEQQLGAAFGVKSLPTVILMANGQPVDGFTGALPEGKIKEFLDKHLPPAEDVPEELALEALPVLSQAEALAKLQADVALAPTNESLRFELVKALLNAGQDDDAKVAFAPVIAQTTVVRHFDALKRWMDAIDFVTLQASNTPALSEKEALDALNAKIDTNRRDFQARFDKARYLMARQQWPAALDELLDILMRDKTWHDDLARKTYIAILDIIEPPKVKVADGQIPLDDPIVATYRRRLSSVILS